MIVAAWSGMACHGVWEGAGQSKGFVKAVMSEYTPNIAPLNDGSSAPPETTQDAPEPAPITEQEVGEYREQDRFLPVRATTFPLHPPPDPPSPFTPALAWACD